MNRTRSFFNQGWVDAKAGVSPSYNPYSEMPYREWWIEGYEAYHNVDPNMRNELPYEGANVPLESK